MNSWSEMDCLFLSVQIVKISPFVPSGRLGLFVAPGHLVPIIAYLPYAVSGMRESSHPPIGDLSPLSVMTLSSHSRRKESAITCAHFPDLEPEVVRCGVCANGPETASPPKPDKWYITGIHGYKVDEGDVLLEGILEGVVCSSCMTSRTGIGCTCTRNRIGREDFAEAISWLLQAPDHATESGVLFTEKEASHVAASVLKRVTRRMDLTDEDLQDLRADLAHTFGRDPKWFPPRITEPTHLPV